MSQFLHDDNNNNAMAIAIPLVFSENSRTKTAVYPFPMFLESSFAIVFKTLDCVVQS